MTHWGLETLWMAHLPLAMVDDPHDVLVLCLGMGNTYRAATLHPARVTAVELSRETVEAYHLLHAGRPAGGGDDRIEIGDARHAVLVTARQFDVITVDPPPPLYAAGTVNFHTREFFELLRARVRPRGVVCQWVPFYDCTIDEYKTIVRTFAAVFERTSIWIPSPAGAVTGVYLIGFGPEARIDPDRVRERLQSGLVAADVRQFSDAPLARLLPRQALHDAEIDAFCGAGPLLEDAHPFLEFPLFRNAGRSDAMRFEPLLEFLRSSGAWR
jgi:spermidine synthase